MKATSKAKFQLGEKSCAKSFSEEVRNCNFRIRRTNIAGSPEVGVSHTFWNEASPGVPGKIQILILETLIQSLCGS